MMRISHKQNFLLFVTHHITLVHSVSIPAAIQTCVTCYNLATYITGIANEMLIGKPPFSTVFKDLLEWIKQCTLEASGSNNLYRPGMC